MPHPVEAATESKSIFRNDGSGTVNGNTGSAPQNNNNANGTQYNYYYATSSGNAPFDKEELRLKEKQACLQSLSFLSIDARRQDIASAHPETCNWFFETAEFRQWHDRTSLSTHNGVLWVKGNPGTGKSTLMKHTLGHCQRIREDYTIAAYFFNARGDAFEKTTFGMLRSLVCQLIDKESSTYERFIPIFRKKQEIHQGDWKWREADLREFLLSEVQGGQSKPLLLFVDALDECSEPHVRDVVGFLEELSVTANGAKTTLNICLSSRHFPHISMKQYQELVMEDEPEHNEDIATYVRHKLTKRDEEIEREVLAKASGVFMWVVLVITMLNTAYDKGKVEAMHRKLREVPDDLDKLFGTLLNKDNPDKHETILMLQWVLFARRLLKPEELYYAMLAKTDPDNLGAWDPSRITRDDIRRRITDCSRGLIAVRKGKVETVQFIHESVNDFLLRNQRLQRLDGALELNPVGTSHDCLKDCCMSYITMDALPQPKDRAQAKSFGSNHPFLEYASTYVFEHMEAAETGHVEQTEFLGQLGEKHDVLERVRLFHNSFEMKPGSRCATGVDLLYITAVHGYKGLLKSLLEKGAHVNAQGGVFGTALQAAADNGDEEIVAMLLEKGADINAQAGLFGTALQAAAGGGNETIVAILLEKGADVNAQVGFYGTALQAAAAVSEDNDEIVAMLLEKGADINTQAGLFGTALQAAAMRGNKKIVAMLLEKGADINAQAGAFGTALQAAAAGSEDNDEIIAMLLEKGADINAQDGLFGTALQAAVHRGYEEIVAILLEKGADINAQAGFSGTALYEATSTGNKEIIAMLLEKGADIQAGVFSTALQVAAGKGDEEIVAMLLEKGADIKDEGDKEIIAMLLEKDADINAQVARLFGIALQATAGKGNEEMVAMLLEKGIDINAQVAGHFSTALQAAAGIGNETIVAILLEKGADVNAQVGLFGTALQVAASEDNEGIVAMLLEKGADINTQGGLLGTALQAAAMRGNEEIIAMLLEKGADINAQAGVFGTALQAAVRGGHEEIVAILLEKGADINAQAAGLYGTALQAAAGEGNEKTIAMSLEKGADVNAQGGAYGTALQAPAFKGDVRIVTTLIGKIAFGATLQAAAILVIGLVLLWVKW